MRLKLKWGQEKKKQLNVATELIRMIFPAGHIARTATQISVDN